MLQTILHVFCPVYPVSIKKSAKISVFTTRNYKVLLNLQNA